MQLQDMSYENIITALAIINLFIELRSTTKNKKMKKSLATDLSWEIIREYF